MFGKFYKLVLLFALAGILWLTGCPPGTPPPAETYPPYEFEFSGQGWLPQGALGHQGFIACSHSTDLAKNGTGSLKCTSLLDGSDPNKKTGEVWVPLSPLISLADKVLSCYVYVPGSAGAGKFSVQLTAKDNSDWSWSGSDEVTIENADTWTYVASTLPVTVDFDITKVLVVGIQVHIATGTTCTDPVYIDSYNWQ